LTNCANLSEYVKTTGANTIGVSYIGGIAGISKVTIDQCYNIADITGAKATVGGIAGYSAEKITRCYNTGTIQSLGVNDNGYNTIGGIIGFASNSVSDCYNTGSVIATTNLVGGIVGSNNEESEKEKNIKNCYNIGVVSDVKSSGGILGSGKVSSNCYYLTGTASYGIGYLPDTKKESNTNASSKNEKELKALASTLGEEFTEDTTNINNGYPVLTWQLEE